MRYTQSDVCNRIILAKCCLADIVIRMFDSQAIGDTENEVCLLEKGLMLKGAIDALCRWYPPVELTVTYEYNAIPSGGVVVINRWDFGDTEIVAHGTSVNYSHGESLVAVINATVFTGSTRALATATTDNRFEVVYTYPVSRPESTPTVTTTTGSVIGAIEDPVADADAPYQPCLSDDQLEGIFNVIDKVCGCNCPDEHSADTIPTNLQ